MTKRAALLNFVCSIILPKYKVEFSNYVTGLKDNLKYYKSLYGKQIEDIELLKKYNYEHKKHIKILEETITVKYSLPKNFDVAVDMINELSPGARATFLYRLVERIDDESIETLQRYVHLRIKEKQL